VLTSLLGPHYVYEGRLWPLDLSLVYIDSVNITFISPVVSFYGGGYASVCSSASYREVMTLWPIFIGEKSFICIILYLCGMLKL